MAGGYQATRQQVVRLDREPAGEPQPDHRGRAARASHALWPRASTRSWSPTTATAPSRRGSSTRSRRLARGPGAIVTVDSRYQLPRFTGVTAATPNEAELEQLTRRRRGRRARGGEGGPPAAGAARRAASLLVTRGSRGMALLERDGGVELHPDPRHRRDRRRHRRRGHRDQRVHVWRSPAAPHRVEAASLANVARRRRRDEARHRNRLASGAPASAWRVDRRCERPRGRSPTAARRPIVSGPSASAIVLANGCFDLAARRSRPLLCDARARAGRRALRRDQLGRRGGAPEGSGAPADAGGRARRDPRRRSARSTTSWCSTEDTADRLIAVAPSRRPRQGARTTARARSPRRRRCAPSAAAVAHRRRSQGSFDARPDHAWSSSDSDERSRSSSSPRSATSCTRSRWRRPCAPGLPAGAPDLGGRAPRGGGAARQPGTRARSCRSTRAAGAAFAPRSPSPRRPARSRSAATCAPHGSTWRSISRALSRAAWSPPRPRAPLRIGFAAAHCREADQQRSSRTSRVTPPRRRPARRSTSTCALLEPARSTRRARCEFPLPDRRRGRGARVDEFVATTASSRRTGSSCSIPALGGRTSAGRSRASRDLARRLARRRGRRRAGASGARTELDDARAIVDGRSRPRVAGAADRSRRAPGGAPPRERRRGGDTGPLHMAAALGTPCVGLYGPTSAERNGPYGQSHRTLRGARTAPWRRSAVEPVRRSVAEHSRLTRDATCASPSVVVTLQRRGAAARPAWRAWRGPTS